MPASVSPWARTRSASWVFRPGRGAGRHAGPVCSGRRSTGRTTGLGNPLAKVAPRPDFLGIIYPGPVALRLRQHRADPARRPAGVLSPSPAGATGSTRSGPRSSSTPCSGDRRAQRRDAHLRPRGHHPGDKVGPDEPPATGGLSNMGGIAMGTWSARYLDWMRDLGFLGKPGVETQAAKDVAAQRSREKKPDPYWKKPAALRRRRNQAGSRSGIPSGARKAMLRMGHGANANHPADSAFPSLNNRRKVQSTSGSTRPLPCPGLLSPCWLPAACLRSAPRHSCRSLRPRRSLLPRLNFESELTGPRAGREWRAPRDDGTRPRGRATRAKRRLASRAGRTRPRLFSTFSRAMSVLDVAGRRIELRGWLETSAAFRICRALVARGRGPRLGRVFDNMQRQARGGGGGGLPEPRTGREYSISLPLNPRAQTLYFGVLQSGTGTTWADDLRLLVDGKPILGGAEKPHRLRPRRSIATRNSPAGRKSRSPP